MSAICTCSTCRLETCMDNYGDLVPGVRRKPDVVRKHIVRDQLRERTTSYRSENPVGDLVVLTTIVESPTTRDPSCRRSLEPDGGFENALDDSLDATMDESDDTQAPDAVGSFAREDVILDSTEEPMDEDPIFDSTEVPMDESDDAIEERMVEELLGNELENELDGYPVTLMDQGIKNSKSTMGGIQSVLCRRSRLFHDDLKLDFSPTVPPTEPTIQSLSPTHNVNASFLDYYHWLLQQSELLKALPDFGDKDVASRRRVLVEKLTQELERLEHMKGRSWQRASLEQLLTARREAGSIAPLVVKPRERLFLSQYAERPYILAIFLLVVVLHSMAAVARHEATLVLATLRFAIFAALATNHDVSIANRMVNEIPKDIRTILSALNLELEYMLYASCPQCSAIYAPDEGQPTDPYPHRCSHADPGCLPCNALLVRPADGQNPRHTFVPLRPYPFQPFGRWLGDLFTRPGIEQHLQDAWKNPAPAHSRWTDIWDAPVIRQFLGPDNKTMFSVQPSGSVHLVFSLFIDWFNPHGNKKAGKGHSIGAIYLACLNLPPHLRFRPENIYLAGIIPGPNEPSLHEVNHFLRPLVDDLLVLWHQGIYISRTAARKTGRLALGAAGHDRASWPQPLSYEDHLNLATRWKDAPSVSERDRITKDHGIRWSELLRLEYWDPTRFALIDSMHNLLLGALRHHCVEVLGIDVKGETDTRKLLPHTPSEQEMWLDKLAKAIKKGSINAMCKPRRGYIVTMAQYNGVVPSRGFTKEAYAQAFLEWSKNNTHQLRILPVLNEPTKDFHFEDGRKDVSKVCFLSAAVLRDIRKDMQRTVLPSWLEAPPANFGSLQHGKLKADQWRTVCTVSMVITLVRLWGSRGTTTEDNKALLENFISLVIAVDQATRRTMSLPRAQTYDRHIFAYLAGLRRLFSHNLVSNHHLFLHLPELLVRFGPVHSWWSFPFERFNGMLARLKKNYQLDKMPLTFLRSFGIGANLRWLLSIVKEPGTGADLWADMMKACASAFGDLPGGPNMKGFWASRQQDDDDYEARYDSTKASVSLNPTLYQSFLQVVNRASTQFAPCLRTLPDHSWGQHDLPILFNSMQPARQIKYRGHHYGKRGKSQRNSFVLIKTEHAPVAAQIVDIFLHSREANGRRTIEPFFVIEELEPLNSLHQGQDPYRLFPHLDTYLCYNRFKSPRVIALQDIHSHFAAYVYSPIGIDEECMLGWERAAVMVQQQLQLQSSAHNIEVMTVTRISKLEGDHKGDVVASAFSPNGSFFATGSFDGVLCIWRSSDKALLYTVEVPAAILVLCWVAPGDTKILCGLEEGMIGCVTISEPEVMLRVFTAHSHPVEKIVVSEDLIASGAHKEVKLWKCGTKGKYFLVDILDPPLQDTLADSDDRDREILVTGLHFIDFGICRTGLAVIYMFHGLSIFDAHACTRLYSVPLGGMIANSSVSCDGKLLATSRIFGGIDLYMISFNEVIYLKSLSRERVENEGHILPVAFIKTSPFLVGGTNRGSIIIWDTRHGHQLAKFTVEGNVVTSVPKDVSHCLRTVKSPVTAVSVIQEPRVGMKFVVCTRGSNFVSLAFREHMADGTCVFLCGRYSQRTRGGNSKDDQQCFSSFEHWSQIPAGLTLRTGLIHVKPAGSAGEDKRLLLRWHMST
ncbi:hypothetical protein NM688_g599 [Phlebia brevispora]|uniref:Uncharacterized protein n=1 Tax=Phlebia brevispora TaxID=194682 RepID=A0ACC1TDN7_9APHY|nr:hypothetical protein NM688_g599 [Phlebia brevispora]